MIFPSAVIAARLAAAGGKAAVIGHTANVFHGGGSGWTLLGASAAAVALGGAAAVSTLDRNAHTTTTQCDNTVPEIRRTANIRERMTRIGHFSVLSETDLNPSICTFVMALSGSKPLTAADFSALWKERKMPETHPRFHQRLSETHPGYFEQTLPLQQNDSDIVEQHVSEALFPISYRTDVLHRIRALQTESWNLSDSLWQVHVAHWGKQGISGVIPKHEANPKRMESLLFFRGHHALADGASIGAALMDLSDEADELRMLIQNKIAEFKQEMKQKFGSNERSFWKRLYVRFLRLAWFLSGSVKVIMYQGYLYICSFVEPNPWRRIQQEYYSSHPSETAERSVSFATASSVEQAKWIARTLGGPKATLNDLFISCTTAAMARLLDYHRQRFSILEEYKSGKEQSREEQAKVLPLQNRMHVAVPVHLRGGVVLPGESVGNRIGALCIRLPGETIVGHDKSLIPSVERFQQVHRACYDMKRTPMAVLSHLAAKGVSILSQYLPSSFATWMYSNAAAGACCVVTNARGPPTGKIHFGGRTVEHTYGFIPIPPSLPVGVVVFSYDGKVELTVTAETWAVPDADLFLSWVMDEYLTLLRAAKQVADSENRARAVL